MKKIFILSLVLVITLSLFVGCSQKGSNSDGKEVTLTWQSYDSIDKYQSIIDYYKIEKPNITIEFEQVPDYATKMLTQAVSGDLPDLINTNTGTTQILGEAGALVALDIDSLKADSGYKFDDLWEAAESYCTYDETWYALPLDGGNYAWVYNKKMFDKAEIEIPDGGLTWDQFEDICEILLDKKDELGIKYPTIFNDSDSSIDLMYPLITQAGGSYLDGNNNAAWNSQAAVTAFSWVQDLVAAGYIPPIEKLGDGYDALITRFNSGEIAMARVALWNTTYLNDSDEVEWVAMESPKGNDGAQSEVLFLNGIGISKNSEHIEEALDFIKFLTSPKGLELYLEGSSSPQIAVRRSQSDLSVDMFEKDKNMEVFNRSLEYGGYVDLTNTFEDQQDIINQYFDEIWYNNGDIQDTLNQMTIELDALLK